MTWAEQQEIIDVSRYLMALMEECDDVDFVEDVLYKMYKHEYIANVPDV